MVISIFPPWTPNLCPLSRSLEYPHFYHVNPSFLFWLPMVGNSVLQPLELRFSNRRKMQFPTIFFLFNNQPWDISYSYHLNNSILFGFPTVGNSVLQPLELRFSNHRKRQFPTIFFLFNNQPWDITSYNRGKKYNLASLEDIFKTPL